MIYDINVVLFTVKRRSRKRVTFTDEVERPPNRLDFSEFKRSRIAFKPLWDSK